MDSRSSPDIILSKEVTYTRPARPGYCRPQHAGRPLNQVRRATAIAIHRIFQVRKTDDRLPPGLRVRGVGLR